MQINQGRARFIPASTSRYMLKYVPKNLKAKLMSLTGLDMGSSAIKSMADRFYQHACRLLEIFEVTNDSLIFELPVLSCEML